MRPAPTEPPAPVPDWEAIRVKPFEPDTWPGRAATECPPRGAKVWARVYGAWRPAVVEGQPRICVQCWVRMAQGEVKRRAVPLVWLRLA